MPLTTTTNNNNLHAYDFNKYYRGYEIDPKEDTQSTVQLGSVNSTNMNANTTVNHIPKSSSIIHNTTVPLVAANNSNNVIVNNVPSVVSHQPVYQPPQQKLHAPTTTTTNNAPLSQPVNPFTFTQLPPLRTNPPFV